VSSTPSGITHDFSGAIIPVPMSSLLEMFEKTSPLVLSTLILISGLFLGNEGSLQSKKSFQPVVPLIATHRTLESFFGK
jgi:hypothetical protein